MFPIPFCVLKLSWVERHPSRIKACKYVFSLVFMYWAYHMKLIKGKCVSLIYGFNAM